MDADIHYPPVNDADLQNPLVNDTDLPDPSLGDGVPPVDFLDEISINEVMHDYVHDYLFKHFINGTWPTEDEFVNDLSKNCNEVSDIQFQLYVDYHIRPKVCPSFIRFHYI